MRMLSIAALFLLSAAPALQKPPEPADAAPDAVVEPGTARAWALLSCSVLFELNGDRHDLLAGAERSAQTTEDARGLLKESWDITTAEQLTAQLDWLQNAGHRGDFAGQFALVSKLSEKEFKQRMESPDTSSEQRTVLATYRKHAARYKQLKAGLLGWDSARYVALCRWGYAAGWLDETEAWKRMDRVVPALQKAYASWDELGEAYCIGRDCWNLRANQESWNVYEKLRTSETSPWRTTPWNLKLSPLEKPPKAVKKP